MAIAARTAADKGRRTARFGVEMQHRHFAAIAAIVRDAPGDADQRINLAHHFALCLADSNPRFDRDRFLRACGV